MIDKNPLFDVEDRLPENSEVESALNVLIERMDVLDQEVGTHWIGGHPDFVQGDIREYHADTRHLDRVLLHLGCDDDINLGDAGMLNVMISSEDLKACNFQKAKLTWDCG